MSALKASRTMHFESMRRKCGPRRTKSHQNGFRLQQEGSLWALWQCVPSCFWLFGAGKMFSKILILGHTPSFPPPCGEGRVGVGPQGRQKTPETPTSLLARLARDPHPTRLRRATLPTRGREREEMMRVKRFLPNTAAFRARSSVSLPLVGRVARQGRVGWGAS